ncbi:MAG: cyclic nucleotide-binding domain-containing protein [Armatimonadia bacterium]|jgi:CRP-like cAMP-binding protein|nr:cyclic nucleotide-binding domain-containing protein [Armatimonadia bacterium]
MMETLENCALFIGCREEERAAIAEIATRHEYPDATTIVFAGDPGHTLYLIEKGLVEVVVRADDGSEKVVAELRSSEALMDQYAGGFFGEMSLIDVEPRSASVRSRGEVTVIAVPAKKLREVFNAHPDMHLTVVLNIARVLSRRLREANERWGT